MAAGILTMVDEAAAEVGKSFIFMGEQEDCASCKFKGICLNLDKGVKYRIVNVRPPVHDCIVSESRSRVVEVEKATRSVCVDKKYAIDGSLITFFPSECGQVGCKHYHQCNPDGIEKEDKVKISSVGKKAECVDGHNRVVVDL